MFAGTSICKVRAGNEAVGERLQAEPRSVVQLCLLHVFPLTHENDQKTLDRRD